MYRITVCVAAVLMNLGLHGTSAAQDFDFCTYFGALPNSPIVSQNLTPVVEDPGTIKVMHGFAHARLNTGNFIRIEQSVDLPRYATQATVFLNGWRMNYVGDDHHVEGLSTFIANIRPGLGKIVWNAFGVLADNDHDKAYEWSYYYTVIAWNDYRLRAHVNHGMTEQYCGTKQPNYLDNFFWNRTRNTRTALTCFPTFLEGIPFGGGPFGKAAVMPRGFGFGWGNDHHLLQIAYNLDYSETVIQNEHYNKYFGTVNPLLGISPGMIVTGASLMSWNTCTILKDDSGDKDYFFGEITSGMAGEDVNAIQPPFFVLPIDTAEGGFGGAGVKSKDVLVEGIPFDYAIPMLTGWDIGYTTSDQHVKDIGVWLENIQYEKDPAAPAGRLRYRVSSVLHDNDDYPDNYFRHKVTILGLRAAPSRGTAPQP